MELLSPVANLDMCKAAVQCGADAIYVGVPNFNARRHGTNSSIEELKKITQYCRMFGVKVYFACNILIFDSELENFAETALPWLELMPDAVILQDIGLAVWFRKAAPWMPIHASTQMTIASSNAVRLAAEMGFSRCILARELSIKQIKEIHADCPNMELEVFVHGALCVSYSGQCNASLIFGGRSANRGDCAQCCRLPYKIFADGKFIKENYAFSPSDLCTLPILDELAASGVCSLKIEGRLKTDKYVAAATSAYRKALDKSDDIDTKHLATTFSRGFATELTINGHTKGHIGFFLGNVEKIKKNKIWVKNGPCIPGDGVVILNEKYEKIDGGRIYAIEKESNFLCLTFARDKNFKGINFKCKIYINDSHFKFKQLRPKIKGHKNREFPGIQNVKFNFDMQACKTISGTGIATPQIHLNSDIKILEKIVESKPDFILVRSLGAFEFLRDKGIPLCGDFSLNVCNNAAAKYFFDNGMVSVRPSLDLNKKEIFDKPTFHTKHCLFSAVFANNKVFPKCGSPCKFHSLEVEDHKGKRHKIIAEEGCRNTVFYLQATLPLA